MLKRLLFAFAAVAFAATGIAGAAMKMPAKLSDQPMGTEIAFVRSIQADLMKRFPTAADAEKAGYVRFTDEDSSGSISYANRKWQSSDPKHPSQLWYDAGGNLIGADFSILHEKSPTGPPKIWGVNPRRWLEFKHPHYHWIVKDPATGTLSYGGGGGKKYTAAGGVAHHPTADVVVKLGKAKSAADVVTTFEFPALWDLQVWVKDNPNGAFAEMNPNVTPTKAAKKDM